MADIKTVKIHFKDIFSHLKPIILFEAQKIVLEALTKAKTDEDFVAIGHAFKELINGLEKLEKDNEPTKQYQRLADSFDLDTYTKPE